MKNQIKDIKIFMCSSGCGKTYLALHSDKYVDLDLVKIRCKYVIDEKISNIELETIKGQHHFKRREDYPQNYFKIITDFLKTDKKLLIIPGQLEIDFCRQNNIDYCLVFPDKNCEIEYRKRLIERGNSITFATEVAKRIPEFYKENNSDEFAKAKIILKKGQYLSDILD